MKTALEAWGATAICAIEALARSHGRKDGGSNASKPGVALKRPVGINGPFDEESDCKTGIMVQSKDEAIKKLPHLLTLNRRRIRHEFERRFSAQRMAHDHIGLYQELLKDERERLVQSAFQSGVPENAQQVEQPTSTVQ